MFPWLWFWSPDFHFPLGGDVTQDYQPITRWFFGAIRAEAGDADIEYRAFQVASYGRQLGHITEVLLDLAEQQPPGNDAAIESLGKLQEINKQIQKIKTDARNRSVADLKEAIQHLKDNHPEDFEELRRQLQPKLTGSLPALPTD